MSIHGTIVNLDYGWSVISLGDGHGDRVNDLSQSGHNTISIGNGNSDVVQSIDVAADYIVLGDGHDDSVFNNETYGFNTVIVGNGDHDTVVETGTGRFIPFVDTIELGSGAHDSVVLGNDSLANVSFGGPDATIDLAGSYGRFSISSTSQAPSVSTNGLDIINGLVKGDHIVMPRWVLYLYHVAHPLSFYDDPFSARFAIGTYSASAHTFTENAAGHDAFLTYEAPSSNYPDFNAVVLVGAAADLAASPIHFFGTLTLG